MNYWEKRLINTQEALSNKNINQVEKQLKKYYTTSMNSVIEAFESTYYKLLHTVAEGKEPTPADLYNLDKYWQLQGQLRQELEKLGNRQIVAMSKAFEMNWFDIYYSINIEGSQAFNTLDTSLVQQMINSVWCADGKSWSQRVWDNIGLLRETLNDGLIEIVATGKRNRDLKNILRERFDVSYSRADALVRTEVAHIQTEAAKKRYEDYGLTEYEIKGNDDDSCGNHKVDCHEMDGKKFLYAEMVIGKNAPPFHPRCKCCILPVIPKTLDEPQ